MFPLLILPHKKRANVGVGIKQQTTFEDAKIPVNQAKALGIPQAGPPFELDVSVTLEGVGQALWLRQQKRACP